MKKNLLNGVIEDLKSRKSINDAMKMTCWVQGRKEREKQPLQYNYCQ